MVGELVEDSVVTVDVVVVSVVDKLIKTCVAALVEPTIQRHIQYISIKKVKNLFTINWA